MTQTANFHGSDLEKIEQIYGIPKEQIVSFSANVNPLGISPKLKRALSKKIDVISTYPDRDYTNLRTCIGEYVGIDKDYIIVGNGSTELISIFIQIRCPKKALILGPTYSEYEREVSLGGGVSLYYPLKESDDFRLNVSHFIEQLNDSIDLIVICNPNNPTSSSVSQKDMRAILDACKQYDIYVMVDETYVEFADNWQDITAIPLTRYYNNIIILRGVSKFFAAPGLRLGYAICGNEDLIRAINQRKNPWTINSLAEAAGELMFTDFDYIQQTKKLISSERKLIFEHLSKNPHYKVYPPTGNFILLQILDNDITSQDLFEKAIRKGFMIRDCSTFPFLDNKFIRFCIMNPEDNDKLISFLENIN
ncbi:pyridoxal phosphate-dependent aminotransferase [Anaerosacchariphilus polymeriproducens]|uniref:Aminotransferase n=1 Tax=Anaerosacchariphilus polymeriproducens TaxID=1812858 RepID=A0A371ARX4_9FIRM|nr:histidinol-phosphate transaminase [Anaerosacchariphilus polymeriproducens]RDU22315.1 aminotransferase class I/II-fold pyridoxal phosphate-dependent enzyme [Anaerosacchariphilus polymeriproducens]